MSSLPMPNTSTCGASRIPRGAAAAPLRAALKEIGAVADAAGFPVYLVGGIVRDLFLRVQNFDVDIVVEGDGITFAGMLVKKLAAGCGRTRSSAPPSSCCRRGSRSTCHGAARVLRIAGSAPTVELSSIKKDLYRRTSRSIPWRSG